MINAVTLDLSMGQAGVRSLHACYIGSGMDSTLELMIRCSACERPCPLVFTQGLV